MEESKELSLKEFMDFIKSQDIVEVLEKAEILDSDELNGRKILCPFHEEKTPSCNFYEDGFYCFGCGEHGDAFAYIQKINDLSFYQSAEFLAECYGKQLKHSQGNPFLKKISNSTLENEWKQFKEDLKSAPDSIKKGANVFFPLEIGYDKKINYYVLRYTSKTGQTLGFTKRRAFETEDKSTYPKWKHSSKENSNIDLCGTFYNLENATKQIRKKKNVILVEGPKDCIPWMLTNNKEVVALSGSHSKKERIFDILPEFDTVTLSLDDDEAGKKGRFEFLEFLSTKMELSNIYSVNLEGMDPYDFYQKNKKVPEKENILSFLTKEELKQLYTQTTSFNKEYIVEFYCKANSVSYKESKDLFESTISNKKQNVKKEDELERLKKDRSDNSAKKMSLKYGI